MFGCGGSFCELGILGKIFCILMMTISFRLLIERVQRFSDVFFGTGTEGGFEPGNWVVRELGVLGIGLVFSSSVL